jgi:hypothetical protein
MTVPAESARCLKKKADWVESATGRYTAFARPTSCDCGNFDHVDVPHLWAFFFNNKFSINLI